MNRARLLRMTALPLVLLLTQGLQPGVDNGELRLVPQARAQGMNPCAPVNPCAPAMMNPCAPAMMNPCAPAMMNPCAPGAMNPCAPRAMNPCAPAMRKGMPAAMGKGPMARGQMAAPPMAMKGGQLAPETWRPFDITLKDKAQAPFAADVDQRIPRYNRAAPFVATSGVVLPEDYGYVASLGFRTVINLRTSEEGADAEVAAAKAAGLQVFYIQVGGKAPSWEQIEEIARIVEDPANYPVLLLCTSANRAGAAWALYRASRGVPPAVAIQEGRAAGLKLSREGKVREMLGLPPAG